MAAYASTGLRAFGEVENALSGELALREREVILARVVADNERALTLADQRYRLGAGDARDVARQQLALSAAHASLLRVRAESRIQRVNLHLALGGGFESPADATAVP
jgi:outer membrane protein TolC